jgi:integrase
MGRTLKRLTARQVETIRRPGMYHDGGGLCLQVTGPDAKSWIYRFMLNGVSREMGLGSAITIPLAEARQRHNDAKRLRDLGIDPIERRKAERSQALLEAAKSTTFREAAGAYIAAHRAGWRNAKHAQQWPATLEAFVYPVFGNLSVQSIDTALIMRVLEPIWSAKPETASRVRGRIERVLDWARVRGYRSGENPARWRGNLDHLLPAKTKVRAVQHHAALPYVEIGTFMAAMRSADGIDAAALEFTILTAARSGETRLAAWDEIDLQARVWTVPAGRMKGGKEHRVPLSDAAMAVLTRMAAMRESDHVFPGQRGPLSHTAMMEVLQRMGRRDITIHGFRATFKTWAGERTNFANHVVELALAHTIGNAVEQVYRRGDLFDKRRKLMDAWATYCARPATSGDVVPMHKKG